MLILQKNTSLLIINYVAWKITAKINLLSPETLAQWGNFCWCHLKNKTRRRRSIVQFITYVVVSRMLKTIKISWTARASACWSCTVAMVACGAFVFVTMVTSPCLQKKCCTNSPEESPGASEPYALDLWCAASVLEPLARHRFPDPPKPQ